MNAEPELYAVIGVWVRENETFYVKRSDSMEDPSELARASEIMKKMAEERLYDADITTEKHILSEESKNNPIDTYVHLDLYKVELPDEPKLNPRYYQDGRWLSFEEYTEMAKNQTCGSCMRMYWDWAWMEGRVGRAFPHS